jgi:hypothetical protein
MAIGISLIDDKKHRRWSNRMPAKNNSHIGRSKSLQTNRGYLKFKIHYPFSRNARSTLNLDGVAYKNHSATLLRIYPYAGLYYVLKLAIKFTANERKVILMPTIGAILATAFWLDL